MIFSPFNFDKEGDRRTARRYSPLPPVVSFKFGNKNFCLGFTPFVQAASKTRRTAAGKAKA
jgi:hypothetical protein